MDLKTDPKYGYFPWWPEDGTGWLHPDDVAVASQLLPSMRVFRRDEQDDTWVTFRYGEQMFRAHRSLWVEVRWEGFALGDWVEVRTRGMRNEHRTGTIREVRYHDHDGTLRYQITQAENPVETEYTADDLKHVDPVDGPDQLPRGW